MRNYYLYVCLLFAVFSCSDDKSDLPSSFLTIENPKNSVEDISSKVTLSWSLTNNNELGDLLYSIYYGRSKDDMDLLDETTETEYTVVLEKGVHYYWYVVANDGVNSIIKSEISEFSISPILNTMEMVHVNGGIFQMGSEEGNTDEKPVHKVSLNSFEIGKYEVTHAQFLEFINEIECESDGTYNGVAYINMNPHTQYIYYDNQFYFKGNYNVVSENTPVVSVTWEGAQAFCKWSGGSLPTEAQWEYAARGGDKSKGYKYSGSNNLDDVAWHFWSDNTSGCYLHEVGEKQPNELGLHDMTGNVWEWCFDWYDENYYSYSEDSNPMGPDGGTERVLRGGYFDNYLSGTFSFSNSMRNENDRSSPGIGFRLARPTK